jgi:hypothetical protein
MIAEWINNIRFDIIEPVAQALAALTWILVVLKIVRNGLREHGEVSEGVGGGQGARMSKRELYLEVLKDHAVGLITVTVLAALFVVFMGRLEQFQDWLGGIADETLPGG